MDQGLVSHDRDYRNNAAKARDEMDAMTMMDMVELDEELPLVLLLVVEEELDVPPLLFPLLVVPVLVLPLSAVD